ncbi:helix-turn-helix domain-containing protein [uncultured Maritalea sp.]|uniref:helix-turn-helix domain-containing protein n=1 Tax=uncultured Maritalea sp. TaxID=757249 RepID=UPI002639E26C|nr:helix-turn-helix domain-containing protein [uncultured Maritalea sp.]
MANPGLTNEQLQLAADAIARNHGNKAAAARELGIHPNTFRNHAEQADRKGILPDIPKAKPRIRVPARSSYTPEPEFHGEAIRVMVYGCSHDSPSIPDKSRFTNMGRLAAHLEPDYIVNLGDALDLDSLSGHAMPGSVDDFERPMFKREMDSFELANSAFNQDAPSGDEIPRYHLMGNHEYRADRFENMNPTAQGVFTGEITQILARYGWTIRKYKEWLYLNGVGFTHVPINMAGKEYTGQNPSNMIANHSTHSVVWSHTHKGEFLNRPKIGIGNSIQVFNSGCSMPQGYIKKYAGVSQTGWTYRCNELTLRDGQIESARSWSILELQEKFGDSKAA